MSKGSGGEEVGLRWAVRVKVGSTVRSSRRMLIEGEREVGDGLI